MRRDSDPSTLEGMHKELKLKTALAHSGTFLKTKKQQKLLFLSHCLRDKLKSHLNID